MFKIALYAIRNGLASRYFPVALIILAILLTHSALQSGLKLDSLLHRMWLLEPDRIPERLLETGWVRDGSNTLQAALMSLFTWLREPDMLIDAGIVPWWVSEEVHLSFWRPLASFTHWVDYQLWPDSFVLMHGHNILWFVGVVALVAILYRELIIPTWVAGLAALLYTLDDNFHDPVFWLATRSNLMAVLFGTLTILAHNRWRQNKSRPGGVLAPICLSLALLSAEGGVATAAYLISYAVFLENGTWRERIGSLAPSIVVIVCWRLIYQYLGYGALNTHLYIDPGTDPFRFALAVVERGPLLLLGQWGWPPASLYNILSDANQVKFWLYAVLFLVLGSAILSPLLRQNRVARFWAAGMLIAVIPICSPYAIEVRHLFFVGLGAMALLAQFIGGVITKSDWLPVKYSRRVFTWGFCIVLIFLHLLLTFQTRLAKIQATNDDSLAGVLAIGKESALKNQEVIIVNAPFPFLFSYFLPYRAYTGEPIPVRLRLLAPAVSALEVTRLSELKLKIRAKSGSLMSLSNQKIPLHPVYAPARLHAFWGTDGFPLKEGQHRTMTGMDIKVIETTESGLPVEVLVHFAKSPDGPYYKWLRWNWRFWSYQLFKLPNIGDTVTIAGPF
jgi:hypothetical protein